MSIPRGFGGVDVILDDGKKAPLCVHGPTLLFQRYIANGKDRSMRRFYACSACRDRKDCAFFQWEDDIKVKTTKRKCLERLSHVVCKDRLETIMTFSPGQRRFCSDCNVLLTPDELSDHIKHNTVHSLTDEAITKPTELLKPLENKKTNSQYMFSKATVQFTLDTLIHLGCTKVLCIGAPTVHQAIQNKHTSMSSLLLDIDHRYEQFYGPNLFCCYNMFNDHFFNGEQSQTTFERFMKESDGSKVAIVIDPPFGGLVEVLAFTLRKIIDKWKKMNVYYDEEVLPVLWFFPYYLESRMLEHLPDFTMLDYKAGYVNHASYQNGNKGRKFGSPVRVFTNVPASRVVLPATEGYWFCEGCDRYSAAENKHCGKCGCCTSKDGHTYVHCDTCQKCVKPSRRHCDTCQRCELPGHTCGEGKALGCHICGDLDHKRKACPKKVKGSNKKRKKK